MVIYKKFKLIMDLKTKDYQKKKNNKKKLNIC